MHHNVNLVVGFTRGRSVADQANPDLDQVQALAADTGLVQRVLIVLLLLNTAETLPLALRVTALG
jgi:hypothetical protein